MKWQFEDGLRKRQTRDKKMKQMKKKLMAVLFMLCVIGEMLPQITAKAAINGASEVQEDGTVWITCGDYRYTEKEDGTIWITAYTGTDEKVVIPSELDGKTVTGIADMAFYVKKEVEPGIYEDASTVKEVVFPDTLNYIGNWNFYQVTSIEIPASVTYIGTRAFGIENVTSIIVDEENTVYTSWYGCNAIIEYGNGTLYIGCDNTIIPFGIVSIGADAFSGCNMESIDIPSSVEEIGYCAFLGCKNLKEVEMSSVKYIGDCAFSGCTNLNVNISASVTQIGYGAFSGCNSITVDPENKIYDSRDNCNAIIEKKSSEGYGYRTYIELIAGCKNTKIPSTVTSIGWSAFLNCRDLTEIEIPAGVERICAQAFSGCSGLTSVTIPASVVDIGYNAFFDCPESMTIYAEAGSYAKKWAKKNGFNVVDITTDEVSDDTPESTSGTQADTSNTSTDTSGTQADTPDISTDTPAIPSTTPESAQNSVKPATKGTTLTVSSSKCKVKVLSGDEKNPTVAYAGTTGEKVTTVKIPATVTVDNVTYKVTGIANKAFSGDKKVKKVTIGKNVTTIGDKAFCKCTALTQVTVPASVNKIGKEAFSGCKKLTKITLKTTKLTKNSIGKNALKGTNKKLVVKAPKRKVAAYKKYFKNKGNKNVKVKK